MPFNSIISRADALPLIPEETVDEVIKAAAAESAALSLFRRVNMGTKYSTLPVLSTLAQAYWVNGDTGLKQTTELAWSGVTLEAEELAAFVPVPEAVVDDSDFDLWGEVQAGLAEAVGVALDAAVFAGTNKPASWPTALIPGAIAAGNINVADTTPEQGGVATIWPIPSTTSKTTATTSPPSPPPARCAARYASPATAPGRSSSTCSPAPGSTPRSPTSPTASSTTTRSPSSATTRWPCSASGRT